MNHPGLFRVIWDGSLVLCAPSKLAVKRFERLQCRMMRWWIGGLLASVLLIGCASPFHAVLQPTATSSPTLSPTATATPTGLSYIPYQSLMAEVLKTGPVYVTADASVPMAALNDAAIMLATMLRHRPDVITILDDEGAIIAIFGRTETVCSLPYFSIFHGTDVCTSRYAGGAGGTFSLPVTACSEKNVLKEPDDPYGRGTEPFGQNVCVHELAHTIMDVGLNEADRERIEARYEAAKSAGLWAGDYAMTDSNEFFAEMSQAYFSAAPAVPIDTNHYGINGPASLKRYDPATFALIDSIYHGSSNLA